MRRGVFWTDLLPDAVHFASCGVVTVIGLVLLPLGAPVVLAIGADRHRARARRADRVS